MSLRLFFQCVLVCFLFACTTGGGVYHTVKKGQTLYRISRTYGVEESYLARINGISGPSLLQSGQQLYIPGAQHVRHVPVTNRSAPANTRARASSPPRPSPAESAGKPAPVPKAVPVPRAAKPETVQAPKKPPTAERGRFIWPAKGKLVAKFGDKKGGVCKGLEIALKKGTAVVSAAAGKVIYSGDGITGYGNLVIVRHDDSYFTVYGYNRKNFVSKGDFVSKGQKIALSGAPPKGGPPRLYFEIRYGKKPVDPIFYLP